MAISKTLQHEYDRGPGFCAFSNKQDNRCQYVIDVPGQARLCTWGAITRRQCDLNECPHHREHLESMKLKRKIMQHFDSDKRAEEYNNRHDEY